MMKPVGNKRKKGGNAQPLPRKSFPEVNQEALEERLDDLVGIQGVSQCFNMLEYKKLAPQQAESPKAMFKLHRLLEALLTTSPSGQIKYAQLKQALAVLCKRWGFELLTAHSGEEKQERSLLPGIVADSVTVLLKHWRRVSSSNATFEKFRSRLEESQSSIMMKLRQKTLGKTLKKNDSEVTMDSQGFPSMLKDVETEGEEEMGTSSQESGSEVSGGGSDLLKSPPPVSKKTWRETAGRMLKRPAAKVAKKASKERGRGRCHEKSKPHWQHSWWP